MPEDSFLKPKVVVIAYSTEHFLPDTDIRKGSAGAIASLLYQGANSVKGISITYIDSNLPRSWPQLKNVDLLVTRDVYVPALKIFYKPVRTLIVAVNQTRRARLSKMKLISKSCPIEIESIEKSTNYINNDCGYLIVGNSLTARTYREEGLRPRNIREVSYGVNQSPFVAKFEKNNCVLLCHIGEISFRKGIDFIAKVANLAAISNPELKIVITGEPPIGFESEAICSELAKLNNVEIVGWVDTRSQYFENLLGRACAALFPTREEGLAGSYLDVAICGIPIFSTVDVGVEIPKQFTISQFDGVAARSILVAIDRNLEDLWDVGESHGKYLQGLSQSQIPTIVRNYLDSGSLGPKIQLAGPIQNKTQKILESAFEILLPGLSPDLAELTLSKTQQRISRRNLEILRNHVELVSRNGISSLMVQTLGLLSKPNQEFNDEKHIISCVSLYEHSCLGDNQKLFSRIKYSVRGKYSTFRAYCFALRPLVIVYLNLLKTRANRL